MKSNFKQFTIILCLLAISFGAKAQETNSPKKDKTSTSSADSLMNLLDTKEKPGNVVIAKSTRYVLSQTSETIRKGNLNFQVIHRFGDIGGQAGGFQTDFGLDRVNDVYIGFEYGITDNLTATFGRTTIGQLIQTELKYALVHQKTDGGSPIAITVLGINGVHPYQSIPQATLTTFSSRLAWLGQVIFARKFSDDLSLQVSPTYVQENTPFPNLAGIDNHFFAVQAAARVALNKHMGFILDYGHPFSSFRQNNANFKDPIGIGYEVETGGHVFTLNLTNANAINELNFLSNTQNNISKGQYRLGFTISRMFDLRPKHKDPEKTGK